MTSSYASQIVSDDGATVEEIQRALEENGHSFIGGTGIYGFYGGLERPKKASHVSLSRYIKNILLEFNSKYFTELFLEQNPRSYILSERISFSL